MKTKFILLLLGVSASVSAQNVIKPELNLLRTGDKIVKQQVEYKDPGRAGENVVWDFGQLQPVNEQYKLSYSEPRVRRGGIYILGADTFTVSDGLIVGREHSTNYFYQFKDSVLELLGYENHLDRMHYLTPLPVAKFPMTYGDSIHRATQSEDLFSGQVTLNTHGEITLVADACGMLVLPSGDTLLQVLRTRSVQTQLADTLRTMDSIQVNTTIETYRFYARGYRYPVFETVKTIHTYQAQSPLNPPQGGLNNPSEGGEIPLPCGEGAGGEVFTDTFTTAFFFPPPQEYSENPDTANLAELERMTSPPAPSPFGEGGVWAGMYYNVSPNPTHADVLFEIYLPRACSQVMLQISNQSGLPMLRQNKGGLPEGISNFTLNIGALPVGNYVLDFWLDGYLVHGGVVMKR